MLRRSLPQFLAALAMIFLFAACTYRSGVPAAGSSPGGTVTYQGNGNTGGTVPVDSTTYQQGQTVTVLGNMGSLCESNCSLVGWNTKADGTGSTYAQGQTFTMGSASVTLYAKWTADPTYTVTYNGNGSTGGAVPVDTTSYEPGQTVTVLGNTGNLIQTDSTFAGWNTKADGTGTPYAQGQTFPMGSANATLYAKWTANPTYTLTYNGNNCTGGAVPVDTTNYEQGQNVTVLGNTGNLIQTHSTFTGWNTKADGTGTTYTNGQTFPMGSANATLYAKWTPNPTYTVSYDGNNSTGGTVPVDTTNYEQGQTVTVLGNPGNLIQTHFTFAGWNTKADGTGTTYTQGRTFPMGSAGATLYAKWTPNPTYAVSYDGNNSTGGTVPNDSNNYEQGQTVTILGNTNNLVHTGYTFAGWNTQADGNGTAYAPGATFQMGSANLTLYAKWSLVVVYTVGYGTGSVWQYQVGTGGLLTPLNPSSFYCGYEPDAMVVASGKYAYMTDAGNSLVWQFLIGADGTLTAMGTPFVRTGTGNRPTNLAVDPSCKHVYVVEQVTRAIYQFAIGTGGTLSPMTPPTVTLPSGSNAIGVTVHPSGQYAYVTDTLKNLVYQYTIGTDGALAAMTPSYVPVTGGHTPVMIAIDPSGKHAYTANGSLSTIGQFTIGSDGSLTQMTPGIVSDPNLNEPAWIAIDPSGRYAYVANNGSSGVSQFTIGSDGTLTTMSPSVVAAEGSEPMAIVVDPSGSFVYMVSYQGNHLFQFQIGAGGGLVPMSTPYVLNGIWCSFIVVAGL